MQSLKTLNSLTLWPCALCWIFPQDCGHSVCAGHSSGSESGLCIKLDYLLVGIHVVFRSSAESKTDSYRKRAMGMWLRQLNATQNTQFCLCLHQQPPWARSESDLAPWQTLAPNQPCLPHFLSVQTETPWAFHAEMQSRWWQWKVWVLREKWSQRHKVKRQENPFNIIGFTTD